MKRAHDHHSRALLPALIAFGAAGATALACQTGSDSGSPQGVVAPTNDASSQDGPSADGASNGGVVHVQILAINDFHGNLEPPLGSSGLLLAPDSDPATDAGPEGGVKFTDAGTALVPTGGASYLAAHVKALRAKNRNTVLVSAGDLTGASPLLSNLFKDEPSVRVMNTLELDFEGVGNHDFDRGLAELLRLQNGGCSLGDCDAGLGMFEGAKYQYLAANVDETKTNQTVFPPYAIKDVGGAKIAFIGLTLEGTPSVTVASAIDGLSFGNEATTVNALVPELKKQGAQAIVVLLHQGAFQDATGTYDTCAGLSGDLLPILHGDPDAGTPGLDPAVDVVVSAHTHQPYDCTIDDRLVTSAASFGRVVTAIDLTIDTTLGKVTAKAARNVPITRDIDPDPDVAALVAEYETRAAPLANRVVGYVTADITANPKTAASPSCETPLGDVIADSQAAAMGADVAFMNPGGIRTDLVYSAPGKTDGTITYAEAFAVQPFANNLVTMMLTGAQIKQALDQQFGGALPKILQVSKSFAYTYTYDANTKKGTVDAASITIGGAPLDLAKSYKVVVNAFVAGGGDSFAVFKSGTDRVSGMVDLDAFTAYLTAQSTASSPLAPPALTRITGNGCQ